MRREITGIVIHCAYTPPTMDVGAADIRHWHTATPPAGNGWADIGYHYVIRRDGRVEKGRDEAMAGAHTRGHNAHTLGICLVGGMARGKKGDDTNFTRHQWASLASLVDELRARYPNAKITGHRDHDTSKTCPTFDVEAWLGEDHR